MPALDRDGAYLPVEHRRAVDDDENRRDDLSLSSVSSDDSYAKGRPSWHHYLAHVVFLIAGLALGYASSYYDVFDLGARDSDTVARASLALPPRTPRQTMRNDQYMSKAAAHLRIANVSRQGDGWAPWQFAIEGDAKSIHRKYPCLDGSDTCPPVVAWVEKTGVWFIEVDPEAELDARVDKYNHTEIVETRLQLTLSNKLHEPTLIHFHGLVPPNNLDGIPWISANPIHPSTMVFYDFMIYNRGFYWMHSHFGDQAGQGVFAPLIVKDHPAYLQSLGNPQDVLMVIFDGHWRSFCAYAFNLYPEECPVGDFDSWSQYTFQVNGKSLHVHKPLEVNVTAGRKVRIRMLEAGTMATFRVVFGVGNNTLEGEVLATDGRHVKRGVKRRHVPLGGASRIDVLLTIPIEGGCFPIIALRGSTVEGLKGEESQQGAILLKTQGAVCEHVSYFGDKDADIEKLDFKKYWRSLQAADGLRDPLRAPDVHHTITLTGSYDNYTGAWRPGFHINNTQTFVWPDRVWCKVHSHPMENTHAAEEAVEQTVLETRMCQGETISSFTTCDHFKCDGSMQPDAMGRCIPASLNVTENHWENVSINDCSEWRLRPNMYHHNKDAIEVCQGDRVWITYKDDGTYEGHPVHLHGHHQQLIKIDGQTIPGGGPMGDTWFVTHGSSVTVALDAWNPGEWLLHCHIEHHVTNGMATSLKYMCPTLCAALGRGISSRWTHTQELQYKDWPHDWQLLWNKTRPLHTTWYKDANDSLTHD